MFQGSFDFVFRHLFSSCVGCCSSFICHVSSRWDSLRAQLSKLIPFYPLNRTCPFICVSPHLPALLDLCLLPLPDVLVPTEMPSLGFVRSCFSSRHPDWATFPCCGHDPRLGLCSCDSCEQFHVTFGPAAQKKKKRIHTKRDLEHTTSKARETKTVLVTSDEHTPNT